MGREAVWEQRPRAETRGAAAARARRHGEQRRKGWWSPQG